MERELMVIADSFPDKTGVDRENCEMRLCICRKLGDVIYVSVVVI
jgi:hypothetical protein